MLVQPHFTCKRSIVIGLLPRPWGSTLTKSHRAPTFLIMDVPDVHDDDRQQEQQSVLHSCSEVHDKACLASFTVQQIPLHFIILINLIE